MKFILDLNKSVIFWKGFADDKFAKGQLRFKHGSLLYQEERIAKGELVIDMTSVQVTEENLDDLDAVTVEDLLKSEEFFSVDLYPEASFTLLGTDFLKGADQTNSSDKIDKDAPPNHLIEGELTVRGLTYRMQVPVHVNNLGHQINARGVVNLKEINKEAYKLLDETSGEEHELPDIELDLNIVANETNMGGNFTENM
jgi:polyisoprenoid-binding protein YceI